MLTRLNSNTKQIKSDRFYHALKEINIVREEKPPFLPYWVVLDFFPDIFDYLNLDDSLNYIATAREIYNTFRKYCGDQPIVFLSPYNHFPNENIGLINDIKTCSKFFISYTNSVLLPEKKIKLAEHILELLQGWPGSIAKELGAHLGLELKTSLLERLNTRNLQYNPNISGGNLFTSLMLLVVAIFLLTIALSSNMPLITVVAVAIIFYAFKLLTNYLRDVYKKTGNENNEKIIDELRRLIEQAIRDLTLLEIEVRNERTAMIERFLANAHDDLQSIEEFLANPYNEETDDDFLENPLSEEFSEDFEEFREDFLVKSLGEEVLEKANVAGFLASSIQELCVPDSPKENTNYLPSSLKYEDQETILKIKEDYLNVAKSTFILRRTSALSYVSQAGCSLFKKGSAIQKRLQASLEISAPTASRI